VLELRLGLLALMLVVVFLTAGASTGMGAFTGMGVEAVAPLALPASARSSVGFEPNLAFMACTIALKFALNPPSTC